MKRYFTIGLLTICSLLYASDKVAAQKLGGFFYDKGVKDLCQAAHVSNDYLSGTYDIEDRYVDITFVSKDHVFDRNVHTSIRLIRGSARLSFSDIVVSDDDDIVKPFDAFGLQTSLMLSLVKGIDKDSYKQLQQKIIDTFHTDVEKWDGKTWALFGLNLEYLEYMLKN